jgi:soluble lytic murein transglycosylase-like protein
MKVRWVRLIIGASVVAILPGAAMASIAGAQPTTENIAPLVDEAAHRFGIPGAWIWAVMARESDGQPRAISSAGAMGLMQIMPATWALLRDQYRLGDNPFDLHDNIMAGAAYLRAMHDRFGAVGMLAAYNAGPGRYQDYLRGMRELPRETRDYVAALAPQLAAITPLAATSPASAKHPRWQQASLFAGHLDRNAGTSSLATDTAQTRSGIGFAELDRSAVGLFVRRSGSPR